MLHHITIRTQGNCTPFIFWRLPPATRSQCTVKNVDNSGEDKRCRFVVTERITHMNYQPRGISDQAIQGPASYLSELGAAEALLKTQPTWNGVTAEAVARMRLQNRYKPGLDIARYTAPLL